MIRIFLAMILLATQAPAQVELDPQRSSVRDGWWSLQVALGLSDITPYRVFTLDAPRRLVLELEDVSWDGVDAAALLEKGRATDLRIGPSKDGWTRLVIHFAEPLAVVEAGMMRSPNGADLRLVLEQVSADAFAANAQGVVDETPSAAAGAAAQDNVLVVMIDPGHGGLDPGADRGGVIEADLMLQLGLELRAALSSAPGIEPRMTRDTDVFIPLHRRISIARAAGADLLISLHADALEQDEAQGASVYTLSQGGGDAASIRIVEHHERGDLLAGVDLTGLEDRVATTLMGLARGETGPAGKDFAALLVEQMRQRGVRLNARPLREGRLAVLSAADFPSVLIEAGFLSNSGDRARLTDQAGRAPLVQAIADAVQIWVTIPDR